MRTHTPQRAFVLAVLLLGALPIGASAQPFDHLQCHKVKDGQKFKFADLALAAQQPAFQMPANCTIKGKAAKFCVPVRKTVTDTDAPGGLIGPGQDLTANDYVCYKMKCPTAAVSDTTITDQFGSRDLSKIKQAIELCVPAVKGVVTTTTTTSTSTTTTVTLCSPGSVRPCYTGPPGTEGVGPCMAGTETCDVSGTGYGPCAGEVTPQPEVPNGVDDDCDGQID